MGAIIDFFQGIGNALVSLVNFIVDLVSDLVWFVGLIGEMIPVMPAFFTWLPAGLATILGSCIAVVVVLRILGRSD